MKKDFNSQSKITEAKFGNFAQVYQVSIPSLYFIDYEGAQLIRASILIFCQYAEIIPVAAWVSMEPNS